MVDPIVTDTETTDGGWKLAVDLDGTTFSVTVDRDYWKKLTDEKEEVGSLVTRSFTFLLDREPKSSIMRSFNLRVIERYFPEYPEKIRKK